MTSFSGVTLRRWMVGTVMLLFVSVGAFVWLRCGGLGSNRGADLALNGAVNRATAEAVGSRSQALEAIRNGRFEHAYEFYRSILEAQWRVDDCLTLGSALLERDQLVLGWAAVEAAHRIDSKHEPSVRALDALRAKLTLVTGSDRSRFHEAASRVELLRLIENGPPLGLFVLGLARYANDAGQQDEFLDRLNSRDHSLLRAVNTTAGAIKLTARLLLETARTTEAVQLLDPLVGNAFEENSAPASSVRRPEAAWLLSRAALAARPALSGPTRCSRSPAISGRLGPRYRSLRLSSVHGGVASATGGSTASNSGRADTRRRFVSVGT